MEQNKTAYMRKLIKELTEQADKADKNPEVPHQLNELLLKSAVVRFDHN